MIENTAYCQCDENIIKKHKAAPVNDKNLKIECKKMLSSFELV